MFNNLKKKIKRSIAVEIELAGEIGEDKEIFSIPFVENKDKVTVFDIENLFQYIEKAAVKAVIIKIGKLNVGLARANSIRKKIKGLSGKSIEIHAYIESPGNIEYFIASAADSIIMPQWSTLNLIGLCSETFFLKDFFSKFHIEPEIEGKGRYKSASELFSRNSMSDFNREMISSIVDENYSLIKNAISESRHFNKDEFNGIIDNGPFMSEKALEYGLIDKSGYYEEVKDEVLKKNGQDLAFINHRKIIKSINQKNTLRAIYHRLTGKKQVIAVITIEGMITEGESKRGGNQIKTCGCSTIMGHLKKAENNPSIGAIILRVQSPGGSALASDLLRSEIERIRDKKPVVISMSDVAASGGYMISLSGNRIYADEFTLTGSIGVISGKFNFSKLLEHFNINHETITRGKNASIYSSLKKFSSREKQVFNTMIDSMYEKFVKMVSTSRNLDEESVEKAAQGRVWTGNQAKEIRIIDEIGSLSDAIKFAKDSLGIENGKLPVFKYYRTKISLGDLGKSLTLNYGVMKSLSELFSGKNILALMPFHITFK